MIEVSKAKGSYIYDHKNKRYLDFVAGVSACSVGHCNKEVINAIKDQSEMYMHVMVYGEFVTKPSLELAKLLAKNLPNSLNCTYFTNSGTEALDGPMKLARRFTGRKKIIAAKNASSEDFLNEYPSINKLPNGILDAVSITISLFSDLLFKKFRYPFK